MRWRGKGFDLDLRERTLIMGVLNVTPDSFSDGGQFFDPAAAIEQGLRMVKEGAEIIDIGGESTRPGAEEVSEDEELRRVLPVLRGLREKTKALISIDSRKPGVAKAAVDCGAEIINDIGAAVAGNEMWQVVRDSGAGYVAMHMLGEPGTMQKNPQYTDVANEIKQFFTRQLQDMVSFGVGAEQVALDPGIGFGKTVEHNLSLLRELKEFTVLGRPLVLGVSRKSFVGKVTGGETGERLFGSIACACLAVASGARVIRTHDVKETWQAVRMTEAVLGFKPNV